jgi:hypothetical protein
VKHDQPLQHFFDDIFRTVNELFHGEANVQRFGMPYPDVPCVGAVQNAGKCAEVEALQMSESAIYQSLRTGFDAGMTQKLTSQ